VSLKAKGSADTDPAKSDPARADPWAPQGV